MSKNRLLNTAYCVNYLHYRQLGEVNHRQRLPSLYCLAALFSFVFRSREFDRKLLKQLWETHKKLPVINIIAQVVWIPDSFMKKFISDLDKVIDKKLLSSGDAVRKQYLQNTPQAFAQEVADFRHKFTQWNIRISNIPNVSDVGFKNLSGFLSSHTNLILQGTLQAFNFSNTVKMLVGKFVGIRAIMRKFTLSLRSAYSYEKAHHEKRSTEPVQSRRTAASRESAVQTQVEQTNTSPLHHLPETPVHGSVYP